MSVTAILHYNKPTLTRRCLTSVERSGARRVLLVDNGSREPLDVPVQDRLRLEPNQGFARGMNAALHRIFANPAVTRAVLLSNDVELPADFHARLEDEPEESGPELLCPHVFHLMDRSKPAYTHGELELATGTLSHHFDAAAAAIVFPAYYPAAATVWNRAAYERLGGFDERYFCYWEDVELSHRALEKGVKLRSARNLRVHHLGRGTTNGKPIYSEHFARGRALTFELLGVTRGSNTARISLNAADLLEWS